MKINNIKPIFSGACYNLEAKPYEKEPICINKVDTYSLNKYSDARVKNYALEFFDKNIYKSIICGDINNPRLKSFIRDLSEDDKLREKVFDKIDKAIQKVLQNETNENTKSELISIQTYLPIVRQIFDYDNYNHSSAPFVAFRGEFLSKEELVNIAGDAVLPWIRATRAERGDKSARAKLYASAVDNYLLGGVKHSIATAAAAKGAAIGTVLGGPAGAAIGSAIGYIGTYMLWSGTRNKVVDALATDEERNQDDENSVVYTFNNGHIEERRK